MEIIEENWKTVEEHFRDYLPKQHYLTIKNMGCISRDTFRKECETLLEALEACKFDIELAEDLDRNWFRDMINCVKSGENPPSPPMIPYYFRAEAAKDFVNGMLSHSTRYRPREGFEGESWHQAIAREAVELADALILELLKN